jgi:hypothetical protein
MRLSYQRGGQLCCRGMRERRVERLSRRRQKLSQSEPPTDARTHWLATPTCRGLVACLSELAASPTVEQHRNAQSHQSTLLLSAVHPVTPYTHTQPCTASRELCGTLSARAG